MTNLRVVAVPQREVGVVGPVSRLGRATGAGAGTTRGTRRAATALAGPLARTSVSPTSSAS